VESSYTISNVAWTYLNFLAATSFVSFE